MLCDTQYRLQEIVYSSSSHVGTTEALYVLGRERHLLAVLVMCILYTLKQFLNITENSRHRMLQHIGCRLRSIWSTQGLTPGPALATTTLSTLNKAWLVWGLDPRTATDTFHSAIFIICTCHGEGVQVRATTSQLIFL